MGRRSRRPWPGGEGGGGEWFLAGQGRSGLSMRRTLWSWLSLDEKVGPRRQKSKCRLE